MTQARELFCLHVRLEEAGDRKRKSPPTRIAPSPLPPFSRGLGGTLHYLPLALTGSGRGWGKSMLGLPRT